MQKCTFCGSVYEFPRGLTYVTGEGKISYFCSSKCRKNALNLRRDKFKVNWVKKMEHNKAEAGRLAGASKAYHAAQAEIKAQEEKKAAEKSQ